MANIAPTKGNLIAAKRSLSLAKLGYELMDRKRTVLIREMMLLIERAKGVQTEIDAVFRGAYAALQEANILNGSCEDIALAAPVDRELKIGYRSVMGVELPVVQCDAPPPDITYGFMNSSSAMDMAVFEFHKVKRLAAELSEIEISVYRLAHAIRKTQKRANALENIIIPKYSGSIRFISGVLEEREREEFARHKVIKARKTEKGA